MAVQQRADKQRVFIRRAYRLILPALIFAGLFAVWQLSSAAAASPLFPPFSAVAAELFESKDILRHLAHTLGRMSAGILLASAAGLPLGIAAASKKSGRRLISLPVYLLHPVPKTLFIPLIVLLSGVGELSKLLLVFLSLLFQIFLSVRDAVKTVPAEYYTSIRSIGGGRIDEIFRVTLPAALPALFSTLRISLGIAAAVLFFAEYFGTEYGMGFYIMDARTRINFIDMYAGILALSLMMLVMFRIIDIVQKISCRWMNI